MKLNVSYNFDHQEIQLSLSPSQQLWPAIRRVYEENSEGYFITTADSLRVPVWVFLSCRKPLAYTLRKHGITFAADNKVRDILIRARENENRFNDALLATPVESNDLKSKLKKNGFIRSLTEEQERNVCKLASLPSGATFSVPGAGKTTEALAVFYFKRNPNDKLLVVCPKNAFAVWEEQIQLCISDPPKVLRLTGGEQAINYLLNSDPTIMLITYQQLPIVKHLIADYLINHNTFLFLDESHRIKRGSEGQWGSTVLDLSHLPIAKLLLTGTPLPNSSADLVPQLIFIYPEIRIEPENIKDIIKPVFVRTTKAELKLPKVRRIITPIQMNPNQRHLYGVLRSEEARQLLPLKSRDKNALRRIGKSVIRLLQLVSNPALLIKDDSPVPELLYNVLLEGNSPKIEFACWRAREIAKRGEKVIIWSNFVENVESISEQLMDLGADFIHGGVEAGNEEEENTREKKIKRFHLDSDAKVLIANPAACSESISLHTVCHYAMYIDRNYNAAQYLQSEDRIHRLGLPKNVETTIEILICPDTIDESVHRRLSKKVNKMANILDDPSLNIEAVEPNYESEGLDQDDIDDFLRHLRIS